MRVTTVLGAATGNAFIPVIGSGSAGDEESKSTEDSIEKLRSSISSGSGGDEQTVEEKLIVVDDVLSNIDALLSNPDELSEEKLEVIEEALSNLQGQQDSNSGTSP